MPSLSLLIRQNLRPESAIIELTLPLVTRCVGWGLDEEFRAGDLEQGFPEEDTWAGSFCSRKIIHPFKGLTEHTIILPVFFVDRCQIILPARAICLWVDVMCQFLGLCHCLFKATHIFGEQVGATQ